ncbi:endochitinase A [Dendrobium catenatum]|uniref:Zonadhesin n=1 Tax=Dendrobium catenatum TaxID=906689 RepID=A0A2I0W768_9ASPA|nr:endochitinase A [Dendrobium catenatum]XP_020695264.1 endochitinase A [Dendrobium catenatum]XP_028553969.1 endochitinase A [Dendrobium catenatum]PKU71491.1 hypothetical protein MA16_Dca004333 [Dendrobium catenatum]
MDRSFRAPELRGRTLGSVMKDKEEDLALFIEMRKRDKERNNLLLQNSDEVDQPLESHLGGSPLFKIAPSTVRKTGMDDFLNSDNEKNDYDWLLTPPGTPLFPYLEKESHRSPIKHLPTPKGHPVFLKSRLANPPDPSLRCTTASTQLMTSSGLNSSLLGMRRPLSSGGSSVTSSRPSTPNGRPSLPTASKPSRSSTPTSRSTVPSRSAAPPPRSSSPARSSTPASRSSIPPASKPVCRSTTPTRRPSTPSNLPASTAPPGRSSSATRSGPATSSVMRSSSSTTTTKSGPAISMTRSGPAASKGVAPSRGVSPTVRSRPWKPSEMPGFSLDAPPNLRTSLPERPSSASRGRPGAPSSRSSSVESRPSMRPRLQSCSPSRGRAPNGNVAGGGSIPAVNRSRMNNNDHESPVVIGTKMVERVVSLRRLAPPKIDEQHSTINSLGKSTVSPESVGFGRTLSKKSLDMALRHMDIRRSMPNNLRPLMTNIPASSMYSVRSGSSRSRVVSISGSPLATSSNASSEQSVSNNPFCSDGNELLDEFCSDKGSKSSPSFSMGR